MAEPYFADDRVSLYVGDCLTVLADLADASVDAIVTDPPAAISFMGRRWDSDHGGRDKWVAWLADRMRQAHRVLKPGGHALVWALPRTSHWTATALEDAGFEIRDCVTHLYGSGFPKSLDVSKAIDKASGVEREVVGHATAGRSSLERVRRVEQGYRPNLTGCDPSRIPVTAPATSDAERWSGWGTALKPGQEIWWLARKPLSGTVAANVLAHGTGALNIDACRIEGELVRTTRNTALGVMNDDGWQPKPAVFESHEAGRWPTNAVFSHLPECGPDDTAPCADGCAVAELDRQSGTRTSGGRAWTEGDRNTEAWRRAEGRTDIPQRATAYHRDRDSGGASRFFPAFRYESKAPTSERPKVNGVAHETVKPLALIRWLARLVTPPGGTVLDPFLGSGTTAEACLIEGFRCVGIERDERYLPLIEARLGKPVQPVLGLELDAP